MKRLILMSILSLVVFAASAQVSMLSSHNLTSDTVTNAGTASLTVRSGGDRTETTAIQVNVTKISGTVGGTITIMGSLDGVNFSALNTPDTQTAMATKTATDATASYNWRLTGNPFLYYRVSYTGTGTMAASFTAKLLAR